MDLTDDSRPKNDTDNRRACDKPSALSPSSSGAQSELDNVLLATSKMKTDIEPRVKVCSRKRMLLNQYRNEQGLQSSLIIPAELNEEEEEQKLYQNNDDMIHSSVNGLNENIGERSPKTDLSQHRPSIDIKIAVNDEFEDDCIEKVNGSSETMSEHDNATETTSTSSSSPPFHGDLNTAGTAAWASQQQQEDSSSDKQYTVSSGVLATGILRDSFSKRPPPNAQKSKKTTNVVSDTEKCKVCFAPAGKHVHYGAITCFSCRAFFRRSIQTSQSRTYVCRRKGNCTISPDTRKGCQKCRFEQCITIGMKPGWVLNDDERARRFRKNREKKLRQLSDSQNRDVTDNNAEENTAEGRDSLTYNTRRCKPLTTRAEDPVPRDNDNVYGRKRMYLQLRPEQEEGEEEDDSSMLYRDGIHMPSSNRDEEIRAIIQRNYPPPILLPLNSRISSDSLVANGPTTSSSVSVNDEEHQINLSQPQLTNKQLLEMLKGSYNGHQNQSRKTAFGFPIRRSLETILGGDREPPPMAEGELAAINDDPVARIFHRDNSDIGKCSPPSSSIRFEDITGNTSLNPPSAKLRQRKQKPSATVTSPTAPSSFSSPPIMREMPSLSIATRLCSIASTSAPSTSNQPTTTSCRRDQFSISQEDDTDYRHKNTLDERHTITTTTTTSPRPGPSYSWANENLIETKDKREFGQALRISVNGDEEVLQSLGPSGSRGKRYSSPPHSYASQVLIAMFEMIKTVFIIF